VIAEEDEKDGVRRARSAPRHCEGLEPSINILFEDVKSLIFLEDKERSCIFLDDLYELNKGK